MIYFSNSSTVNVGFAKRIENADDLPFLVNWCGPDIKPMEVNDEACLNAMIKIVGAVDELQPDIKGRIVSPVTHSPTSYYAAYCSRSRGMPSG